MMTDNMTRRQHVDNDEEGAEDRTLRNPSGKQGSEEFMFLCSHEIPPARHTTCQNSARYIKS